MKRTKLAQRTLPAYTRGEETANMVTHIIGGVFGIFVLIACLMKSNSAWDYVGASVYGGSMMLLYTISAIYHGLTATMGKKVLRILDHCTIYFLIGGTYTPILLSAIRPVFPGWAWTIFGIVWGCAVMATVFTAIDLKKYSSLSMTCYIAMGWCILLAVKPALHSVPIAGLLWILAGGIAYTVGAALYGVGKKKRYFHTVFHIFVLFGSAFQFVGIIQYVL